MRKKLLAVLACLTLILGQSLTVSAASTDLPISKSNSYIYWQVGGETYEYTVPFTANYEITLAGTQGASYSNNSGGYGYQLKKVIRLNYQDKIKFEINDKPIYSQDGSAITVPQGLPSKFYVNDELVWTAGGGAGQISNTTAPNGVTTVTVHNVANIPVHWHTGNGKSGATHSNTFPTVYGTTNPGGCYGAAGHAHNAYGVSCPPCVHFHPEVWETCNGVGGPWGDWSGDTGNEDPDNIHNAPKCTVCGGLCSEPGAPCGNKTLKSPAFYEHKYDCGDRPTNIWSLKCGYRQGQIYGFSNTNFKPGDCYYADGFTPTATLNRAGNGMFSVKLMEQSTLSYNNGNASNPFYMDGRVDLTILDNVVCFYKRR